MQNEVVPQFGFPCPLCIFYEPNSLVVGFVFNPKPSRLSELGAPISCNLIRFAGREKLSINVVRNLGVLTRLHLFQFFGELVQGHERLGGVQRVAVAHHVHVGQEPDVLGDAGDRYFGTA